MTLRHTAALALVGWYLMSPPDHAGPNDSLPGWQSHAPLSAWQIIEAFDTTHECKSASDKLTEDGARLWNTQITGKKLSDKEFEDLLTRFGYDANAGCFASDDPRLKGN
jgi:hypothetical protein